MVAAFFLRLSVVPASIAHGGWQNAQDGLGESKVMPDDAICHYERS